MHNWNDNWPYWDELYRAEKFFNNLYERCTYLRPVTKEKYGTIRYGHTMSWINCQDHCRIFREVIRRTVKKFPNVAAEICDNARHVLYDDYFEGWCAGVVFKANGAYWVSDKRPNGV